MCSSDLKEALYVSQPPEVERTWTADASGDWTDIGSWYYWNRPDTATEIAVFGSAAAGLGIVGIDDEYTVRGLRFSGATGYEIAGGGGLRIEASSGPGSITVEAGLNKIDADVHLAGIVYASVADDAELFLAAGLTMTDGAMVNLSGAGRLAVAESFDMGSGWLVVDGPEPFRLPRTRPARSAPVPFNWSSRKGPNSASARYIH